MAKAAKKAVTETADQSPKKSAAKTATEAPKKAAPKKAPVKAKAGLMAPVTVSPVLAKVIGTEPSSRPQIIKKMWDYIKQNDLQDKNNRRMINADENLKKVFDGKEQISMFELAKVIGNHIK